MHSMEEKVTRLLTLMEGLSKRFERHEREQTKAREDTTKTLYGESGQPGLIVKVDRMEQNQKRTSRGTWLAVSILTAALIANYVG